MVIIITEEELEKVSERSWSSSQQVRSVVGPFNMNNMI